MLPVPATHSLFPLTWSSPLFPNRMFRLSCVTFIRNWAMSSWPTETQPWQRFVSCVMWKNSPNNYQSSVAFQISKRFITSVCRNISPPTFRLSSRQAESWLEIFTTASRSCGTELRRWPSARRRMQLIFSCLAESSGISLLWVWSYCRYLASRENAC